MCSLHFGCLCGESAVEFAEAESEADEVGHAEQDVCDEDKQFPFVDVFLLSTAPYAEGKQDRAVAENGDGEAKGFDAKENKGENRDGGSHGCVSAWFSL